MTGEPRDTEDRLIDLLDQHVTDTDDEYQLERESWARDGHRISSPVEPCDQCGERIFLLLAAGQTKPVWLQFGEVKGKGTFWPTIATKRHSCGDGDSWSVEAALFVESATREWAMEGAS